MANEPQNRVRVIFSEALEIIEPDRRAEFLTRACAGDEGLRRKVEQLLAAEAEAGGFLAPPPVTAVPNQPSGPQWQWSPGMRIGRYTLLEPLGEGGCGMVFLAEQEEPVRRQVALKIIKPGMDTRSVIHRFEAERQALALMDHASIARIYDAGATEDGRPYFVMELVRGIRITDYCDQHQLGTRERLDLFIRVCQGVQHAHQKGIIHRDLKPSNVLVTVSDGTPVPKIIDFGIAKATDGQLGDPALRTLIDQFIGTPAYMSPEQATTAIVDIDTRSDIYSLGVLLYELLTGRTPFDPKELARAGLEAMRRTIREDDPLRPSTRLRGLAADELTTTLKCRQTDGPRLLSLLAGDLDWVVMKCLEKDRARRYATANGLATDLERFLASEPVAARPPTTAYQFGKLVRRHRFAFASAGAVLAALVAGIVVSSLEAARARTAEREQARLTAEARTQVYASDMARAQEAIRAGNLGQARELLGKYRPQPRTGGDQGVPDWEWRHLWPQCQSEAIWQLNVTSNPLCSLAVSADGRWVAVGEEPEGGVTLVDRADRQTTTRLPAGQHFNLVAFSPTSPLLAYSGTDSTDSSATNAWVRLWDPVARQLVRELPLQGDCNGLAFTADGKTLVTATTGQTGQLTVWRLPDGSIQTNFPAPQPDELIHHLFAFAPAGTLAAYGNYPERTVSVVDWVNGQTRFTLTPATNAPHFASLAFSPDGTVLATAAALCLGPVRFWAVGTGKEIRQLTGHDGDINAMAFSRDGHTLAGACSDASVYIWNLDDPGAAARPRRLQGHRDGVSGVAMLPADEGVVSASQAGEICLWGNTNRSRPSLSPSRILPGWWHPFAFTTNGEAILAVDHSGRCVRWRGPDFAESQTLMEVGGGHTEVAAFSHDRGALAVAYTKGLVRVFDLTGKSPPIELAAAAGADVWMDFLPAGRHLLLLDPVGRFHEWDLAGRYEINSWQGAAILDAGDISPDGRWCLTLGSGSASSLYDLRLNRTSDLRLDVRRTLGAAFSPDGTLFAAVGLGGRNKIWETGSWRERVTLSPAVGKRFSAAFSPDGRRLAVGGSGNSAIALCDVPSGQVVLELAGQGAMFKFPAFSPDGTLLAASSAAGLHLWRAPTYQEIEAKEAMRPETRGSSTR